MPGPFTIALALMPAGVWPKGIFSLDPGIGLDDWKTDAAFCVTHSQKEGGYALSLTQGYYTAARVGLQAPVQSGAPTVLVFSRPTDAGAAISVWRDGKPVADQAAKDLAAVVPSLQQSGYVLGARVPPSLFGRHDLYEVLVYDRVLSAEELKTLHGYLLAPRRPETAPAK
jgi:hypothetical protein